ncbi:hypothetical protein FPV67DRAFT_1448488 [Lyophyllum atratum]|nr:hypothetical protein FPV67DRAFT_1448488 [Lyophyllum atratum]
MSLVTVGHLGDLGSEESSPHWVAIVIDTEVGMHRFGDSFRNPIPKELRDAYEWWSKEHGIDGLTCDTLLTSHQLDSHACGLFAHNALEHHIDPESCPLMNNVDVAAERLREFNTVAAHILARLPANDSKEAAQYKTSEEEELTWDTEDPTSLPIAALQSINFTFTSHTGPSDDGVDRATSGDFDDGSDDHEETWPGDGSGESEYSGNEDDEDGLSSCGDKLSSSNEALDDVDSENPAVGRLAKGTELEPPLSTSPRNVKDRVFGESLEGATSHEVSKKVKHRSLTSFWHVETPEEKEERVQGDFEKLRLDQEKRQQREERERQDRVHKRREQERLRQQKHREREREEKIANGWVPGLKRKRSHPSLEDFDDNNEQSAAREVAENSRPRRQFKEDQQKKKKPCGRKRVKEHTPALLTNWFQPAIWDQIQVATRRAGKPWSPRLILREAQRLNPKCFAKLTEQVVGRWIDQEAKAEGIYQWRASILERVRRGNAPGGEQTRFGVLDAYPDVKKKIEAELTLLREASVPLTLITIRGVIVAIIDKLAPDLFTHVRADGTRFKCSDSFVRKFLRKMGWSERRATKAAQKLPDNLDEVLMKAFLREAYVIRDHAIPAELRVNTDQTQTLYQHGAKTTWNQQGAKQVKTVGQEEKRAFTLVPSISASGELLPMQAIYHGGTSRSLPSPSCTAYKEAIDLRFCMRPSKTSTYWSTQETMRDLVNSIIAPYFESKKKDLGLPPEQRSIWLIDCWTVSWIVNAINELSDKQLISKAFERCRIGDFNLSHASLTSPQALAALRNLSKTDRDFLAELEAIDDDDDESLAPVADADEAPFSADPFEDSSDVPLDVVLDFVTMDGTVVADGFGTNEDGNIIRSGNGEDSEAEAEDVSAAAVPVPVALGRGNRVRKTPKLFGGSGLWEGH